MMRQPTTRRSRRRQLLLAAALVSCVCATAVAPGVQAAPGKVGALAMGTTTANPPAFIPNWDGHTDSTMLSYTLVTRSAVTVQLVDGKGRVIEVLEQGVRSAGSHIAVWDGRSASGTVMAAGTYRLRINARPVQVAVATDEPGSANAGVDAGIVTGTTEVSVVLQQPPVAITGVELSRGSLGRARKLASTSANFQLSAAASVSAVVIDSSGRVVRTLHAGRMAAGAQKVSWGGTSTRGRTVADGDYSLLVAATGAGRPTETMRQPLRVDRTVPKLTASRAVKASSTMSSISIPVKLTVDEAVKLQVKVGRRVFTVDKAAGTHSLTIAGTAVGLKPRKAARTLRGTITATDATGNARVKALKVIVPRATKRTITKKPTPKPTPPAPTAPPAGTPPTEAGPPAVTSKLTWPIDGILTSPFGPRDGRMHQGLDLAAPSGTPIHAAAGGVVNFVGDRNDCYGNVVVIDHPNGVQTWYAHQVKFGKYVIGDRVERLDIIGYVGTTGCSTGNHLHFEVRIGGKPNNPLSYLPKR